MEYQVSEKVRYIQPENDILNLIRQVCAPASDPGTYDMNALSHVTDEMAYHFYEIRDTKVQEILDMDYTARNFTPLEKDMVMKREQQIAAPFEYDYTDGWKVLLTRIFSLLFLLTGVAVCIIISPLFSYEYQTGTDAVILSAKCGRRETVLAKITAGFLVTSMIYTAVDIYSVFSDYVLFPVGGAVLTLPCVILIAAVGVAVVSLPITHRQFCRHQVV